MAPVEWTRLGGPGEVIWAKAAGDVSAIAVGTSGGHLYLRRRTGTSWRWEYVGVPPTADEVLDAALLPDEGADGVTPVVVGGDVKVWLHRPGAAPTPWTGLAGPAPDPGLPFFAECGDIVASTVRRGAVPKHTLVVSSPAGRPWMRQGVDPDGTWFRIAADDDWIAMELATALASVAPGAEPQQHVFAVVRDRQSGDLGLRVAVHEEGVWTWIDPGAPAPDGQHFAALTATGFRDAAGMLLACTVLLTGEGTVSMIIGSGREWQLVDLGRPPVPREIGALVVALKGPDPRPGDEPVVVVRVGHNIWTRSLRDDWTDLGTTPQDVAVVSPNAAFEIEAADGGRLIWMAGVSWAFGLWTLQSDAAGARWEDHGRPGPVASIVGAYTDPPLHDTLDRPVVVAALDERGELWNCVTWGNSTGLFVSSESWVYHGRPAPGVGCAKGVGAITLAGGDPQPAWVFVIGDDGRLWARTADAAGWTWVDHGAPAGRSVKSGVAPIAADPPGAPAVHVLADDGRLWMRSASGGGWSWTDRGAPPGQLIFAIAGAALLPTAQGRIPVAAVVTGDGHLWVSVPDGASFRWTDQGVPAAAEKIVAGIGIEVVTVPGGPPMLDIVVVGSPSGQVWSHRWPPGGTTGWTAHGRPADARIRAAVGTMPDPANPAGCLVVVVGNDHQVWATSSAGGAWSRWDPQFAATTVTGGKAALLLDVLPCALVLDGERLVHAVTPVLSP
ncbi:hypothetical protein [Planobispora rosea]|uniref:hypothetical protein n=1 Tax=Planobispora rosea TaxID=35762 RepID=UPI00083B8C1E|nr:hypothetical protein [Planobispora rosea]